jgi:hypothetical protein
MMLDEAAPPVPDYLMSLIAQLEEPTHLSPSIVPDLDLEPDCSTHESNSSLASLAPV